jgi:hypothetical protein
VFENRLLGGMFEPEREEITRYWKELHSEGFLNFFSSPGENKMGGAYSMHGSDEKWVRDFEPGGLRRGWEDNIKIVIKVIGYENVDWICLVENKNQWRTSVSRIMNLRGFHKMVTFVLSECWLLKKGCLSLSLSLSLCHGIN